MSKLSMMGEEWEMVKLYQEAKPGGGSMEYFRLYVETAEAYEVLCRESREANCAVPVRIRASMGCGLEAV
jgi:hypothetical protein